LQINWQKMDGLVPAIVQDADSGEVLMLGYMDQAALEKTRKCGLVTFFSRSRQCLWTKGETSGNILKLKEIAADCDGDALLVTARPQGPTCHLGTRTCFGDTRRPALSMLGVLDRLVAERQETMPADSYTTELFESGVRRIAQKVGEEGVETALAAATEDDPALLGEAADLVYHLLVLLHSRGLSIADVGQILEERHTPA
jgi:phosphoribosyl-ATP pyrophosphohydrolase/phosphoribosyl-AMP cyclohydrolase